MKIKILATLLCLCIALLALASCDECEHADANDDFICDNCGEDYDDGYETVLVNFTVNLDADLSLEGKKRVLFTGTHSSFRLFRHFRNFPSLTHKPRTRNTP